jgi:hypothetical protein
MTQEKEEFLQELQEKLRSRMDEKFRKGDAEHQSDLMNIDALEEAFDELIDGLTYVYVEMKRIRQDYERGKADGFKSATILADKEDMD